MNEFSEYRTKENHDPGCLPERCPGASRHRPRGGPTEARWGGLLRRALRTGGTLLTLLGLACSGCQSPGKLPAQPAGQSPDVLVAGDKLKLTFLGAGELTQVQQIRMDGKISLPLIKEKEIDAAGKKISDLTRELSDLYKSQLSNPEIVVTLEESTQVVYVSGAVAKPGKIPMEHSMTMLEAIGEAGGFTPQAIKKKVSLIHKADGRAQTFNLDSDTLRRHPAPSFFLRPGDMIEVPADLLE